MQLDIIESTEFTFDDSPHTIIPRASIGGYDLYRPPDAEVVSIKSRFTLNISDSIPNIYVTVSEQCQGVPINQTFLQSISPDVPSNFFNFLPNGGVEIIPSQVTQVGNFTIVIVNQLMLQSSKNSNYRVIEYINDDPLAFTLELINLPPQLKTNINRIEGYVNKEIIIDLVFIDSEDDHVGVRMETGLTSFNTNGTIEERSKNVYIIIWTPSTNDIGISEFSLFYFDNFHSTLFPVLIQVEILEIKIPYFESNLTSASIYAGQQSDIPLPLILNPSNSTIDFKIQISYPNSTVINSTAWMNYTQSLIELFPKCELLGSNLSLNLTVNVSISINSTYSFILKILKNTSNKVCDQTDLSFIAGIPNSVDLTNRVDVSNLNSMEIIVLINELFYKTYFAYTLDNHILSIKNSSNNNLNFTRVYLSIFDGSNTNFQTNLFDLKILQNYPPTVVVSFSTIIFYYGNLNNSITFPENPFIDDDKMLYSVNECFIDNRTYVSFSMINSTNGVLSSIRIFFSK